MVKKEFDQEGEDIVNGVSGIQCYYFGKRYYDPELGTFTSADPAEQYWNLYSYCGSDPVNYTDPDGAYVTGYFMLAGLAIGATAGTIYGYNQGARGWDLFGYGLAGGSLGLIGGALIGGGFDMYKEITGLYPWDKTGIGAHSLFDRSKILDYIQKYAGEGFKFVGKSLMYYPQLDNGAASSYYRDRLIDAIHSDDHLDIYISSMKPNKDYELLNILDETLGKNNTFPKKVPVEGGSYTKSRALFNKNRILKGVYITGKPFTLVSENMTVSPEEILLHELVGHGIPDIAGSHTGNAITNDNIARKQIGGLRLRKPDPTHLE